MIDHALGVAGGARREVERDGLPFVVGKMPVEVRVAFLQQRLIVLFAQPLAADVFVGLRVVDVDDNDIAPQVGQRLFDGFRELGVGNQHLGFAVVQAKSDGVGVEADVERIQRGAAHRHAEGGLDHFRRVGPDDGDGIANPDLALGQGPGKAAATGIGFGPGKPLLAVDDGNMIGIDRRRTADERQRRQLGEVGGAAIQALFVDFSLAHWRPRYYGLGLRPFSWLKSATNRLCKKRCFSPNFRL